jgi:Family of unknown function (DUF6152)
MSFLRSLPLITAGVLLCTGTAVLAHHSLSGVFDITKSFEIDGMVSRVDWMNPHVYVYVDAKGANGKLMTYRLESLPVAMMRKAGLSKTSLLGDGKPVKVHAYPARAGTPDLGYMLTIKFADGREIQFSKIPGAESVTPK